MKTNRTEFLAVLKSLLPATATNEIVPQTSSFFFDDSEHEITAYNSEIAIRTQLDHDIGGAVDAKALVAVLTRFKDDEVTIETDENELRVLGKRAKAGIALEKEITAPISSIPTPERMRDISEGFISALTTVSKCASTDLTRPLLTAVHVTSTGVEACDAHRLARVTYEPMPKFKGEPLIPAAWVKEVADIEPVKMSFDDTWAHFANDDLQISVRLITTEGEYPKLQKIIDSAANGKAVTLPDEMGDILKRASALIDNMDSMPSIDIVIEPGKLKIASTVLKGWTKETVKTDYDGEPISFCIQPQYFADLLDLSPGITVNENALRLDVGGLVHVIALMRKNK